MALIALCSIGHSAGTTTTAVALTMNWPRPALLIEADPRYTSTVLAGHFRGQVAPTIGLSQLSALAGTAGSVTAQQVFEQSLELAPERHLVPAFASLGAARGASAFWRHLVTSLAAFRSSTMDVLVDLGSFTPTDPARAQVITAADLTAIVTGSTLPDLASLVARVNDHTTVLNELQAMISETGRAERLAAILIDRAAENYSPREVERAAGIPVLGHVPWAPESAAKYSLGKNARDRRDRYANSIRATGERLTEYASRNDAVVNGSALNPRSTTHV